MKSLLLKTIALGAVALCLSASPSVLAGDARDHSHVHAKNQNGPNKGRIIRSVEPHLELSVLPSRKVQVVALTEALKEAKPSGISIAIAAGERSNPVKLQFQEVDGKLISTEPLPAGDNYPVSVSIKREGGGKTVYEKFTLNLAKCPECGNPEYACICEHAH